LRGIKKISYGIILLVHHVYIPAVIEMHSRRCYQDNKQVLPKSLGNSRVATPHGREWARPLRVLAVQCPLQQASPITQPRVRYIHNAVLVPHSAQPTRCKVAATRDFFLKSPLHFSKFLVNVNFDLV